jgi:electron transfer flavoprotein alpha subunit
MPRARQVGITGHSIAPRLYIAIGISGRFNHTIGVRQAGTIVGVNTDPDCEFWEGCDIGLVADWREALPALVERLA